MPGKSHRKRGKHSARGKKRKGTLAGIAPQKAVEETYRSATVAAPPSVRQAPRETRAAVRYPYVASELRRIGILAGVMLVILVVLSMLLP